MPVNHETMHKILTAIVLCATSFSAFAGPCTPFDDQKMNSMSADELAAETCKASKSNAENYDQVMLNLDARAGAQPHPKAQENFDQCEGQIDRMLRVLRSKDVHEKVGDLCKREKQGSKPAP